MAKPRAAISPAAIIALPTGGRVAAAVGVLTLPAPTTGGMADVLWPFSGLTPWQVDEQRAYYE